MWLEPLDWLFQNIAEVSKHSRRIHALYFGFVFFCALTLFGTSDRQIILDNQLSLPLFGSNISFSGFCFAIMVIGICIFAYLQIYIQRLMNLTLKLKSGYPLTISESIYPWLVNIVEKSNPGIVGFLERSIMEASIWYLLPILLSIIPVYLVRTHWTISSYVSAVVPLIGIALVMVYRARYERVTLWQLVKVRKGFDVFAIFVIAWSIYLLICIPAIIRGTTLSLLRMTYEAADWSDPQSR